MTVHFLLWLSQLLMGIIKCKQLEGQTSAFLLAWTECCASHRVGAGSPFLNSLRHVMAPSSRPRAPSGTVEVMYCYPLSFVEPQHTHTHKKMIIICLSIRSAQDHPESESNTLSDSENYYIVKNKRDMFHFPPIPC